MKILVADDDRVTRRILEVMLAEWGCEIVLAADGNQAWEILQGEDPPKLALLDWLMPGLDGVELCRRLRASATTMPIYVILLTVRDSRQDIVVGLGGGADDYITKPFDIEELHARLNTGLRIVGLQCNLANQVQELKKSLERVQQLQGLLPICAYCKSIRDDQNYWQEVESYLGAHADVHFSHGICPGCYETNVKPDLQRLAGALGKNS